MKLLATYYNQEEAEEYSSLLRSKNVGYKTKKETSEGFEIIALYVEDDAYGKAIKIIEEYDKMSDEKKEPEIKNYHHKHNLNKTIVDILFSFEGRISRNDYWLFFILPICIPASFLAYYLNKISKIEDLGNIIVGIVILWPSLALQVKRWHDRNKSGRWVLINLIPFVGLIWNIIETGFLRGTIGENRFGFDPVEEKKEKRSIGIIIFAILFIIIGISNILSLPQTVTSSHKYMDFQSYAAEEAIKDDSEKINKDESEKQKYAEYMSSAQGKKLVEEINSYHSNIILRLCEAYLPLVEKIMLSFSLLLGISLLMMKSWARIISVCMAIIEIPLTVVVNYIYVGPLLYTFKLYNKYGFDKLMKNWNYELTKDTMIVIFSVQAIFVIILCICIIIYFTRPKVKLTFGK